MNVIHERLPRVAVLGPVRAWRGEEELALGAPQQRAVLAALVLRRGRPATVGELIDAIWGQNPPSGAVTVLRTYVSRLRKVLEPAREAGQAPQTIVSAADGYLVRIPEDALDLGVFEKRVAEAKKLRTGGDLSAAGQLLHAALEVWDGKPLAGLPGPLAEAERYRLDEQRLSALEARLDIDLELGRHEDVAAELTSLTSEHPLRERLAELLVLALHRCGRQAEAQAAYQKLRSTLKAELGVEPGPTLLDLQGRILAGDPTLRAPLAPEQTAPAPSSPLPDPPGPPGPQKARPAHLPADLPVFTGRHSELAQTDVLLPADGRAPTAVVISAIGGMAGVGKTTLAVHWAHEIAHRFPDGQLFVNLRGFDPSRGAMPPDEAIHTFLDALGVPAQQMPNRPDARAALYRSLLAERRVLLLLDNARDTEQVRPLLPAGPGSLAIVTSRNRLTGLIANDGARPLTLSPLSLEEARDFLARRIGADRLTADPKAADEIIARCAHLPLALAIVAARAATHPSFPLHAAADELRESHGSLDAFEGGDLSADVRAVFSWSYRALSTPAARLFQLLALHPGPDISAPAAAGLAGLPLREVRSLLAELTHAHLLIEHYPGRYTFHDLLRIYAVELANSPSTARSAQEQAVERLLAWYLHTADAASRVLTPQRPRTSLTPMPPDCSPLEFTTYDQALGWCTTERANLVTVIEYAASAGHPGITWRLAAALWGFFYLRSHTEDWVSTNRIGLSAARGANDREGEAESFISIGNALASVGQWDEAVDCYYEALPVFQELDDRRGVARVTGNLGDAHMRAGRYEESLTFLRQTLRTDREMGDNWGEGICLNNLGEVHLRLGRYEEALYFLELALDVHRPSENRWLEGVTLVHLGSVHHQLSRHHDALDTYHQALAAHRDVGNRWGEAHTISLLSDVHLAVGDPDAARDGWNQALRMLEEFNHPEADEIRDKLRALDDTGPGTGSGADPGGGRRRGEGTNGSG